MENPSWLKQDESDSDIEPLAKRRRTRDTLNKNFISEIVPAPSGKAAIPAKSTDTVTVVVEKKLLRAAGSSLTWTGSTHGRADLPEEEKNEMKVYEIPDEDIPLLHTQSMFSLPSFQKAFHNARIAWEGQGKLKTVSVWLSARTVLLLVQETWSNPQGRTGQDPRQAIFINKRGVPRVIPGGFHGRALLLRVANGNLYYAALQAAIPLTPTELRLRRAKPESQTTEKNPRITLITSHVVKSEDQTDQTDVRDLDWLPNALRIDQLKSPAEVPILSTQNLDISMLQSMLQTDNWDSLFLKMCRAGTNIYGLPKNDNLNQSTNATDPEASEDSEAYDTESESSEDDDVYSDSESDGDSVIDNATQDSEHEENTATDDAQQRGPLIDKSRAPGEETPSVIDYDDAPVVNDSLNTEDVQPIDAPEPRSLPEEFIEIAEYMVGGQTLEEYTERPILVASINRALKGVSLGLGPWTEIHKALKIFEEMCFTLRADNVKLTGENVKANSSKDELAKEIQTLYAEIAELREENTRLKNEKDSISHDFSESEILKGPASESTILQILQSPISGLKIALQEPQHITDAKLLRALERLSNTKEGKRILGNGLERTVMAEAINVDAQRTPQEAMLSDEA